MAIITVSENQDNQGNLLYIQTGLTEIIKSANCKIMLKSKNGRSTFNVDIDERYSDIVKMETLDKVAEIIAIKYKYDYFKKAIKVSGLSSIEKEILLASLISADLDDDKKYALEKIKRADSWAIDGLYNFWLKPLKRKWEEIVSYMPTTFLKTQLKDFVLFLLENKKKRVYIDCGKVYDSHFRRLNRVRLLDGEEVKIIREVLLSSGGEVELCGEIPKDDEYYLKEFYGDKIFFSNGYFG